MTALSLMRVSSFEEGKSAQILHVGPFSQEAVTIEKLHQFIESRGGKTREKHHEIYLSDMRRVTPWLRQAFPKSVYISY